MQLRKASQQVGGLSPGFTYIRHELRLRAGGWAGMQLLFIRNGQKKGPTQAAAGKMRPTGGTQKAQAQGVRTFHEFLAIFSP